MKNKIITFIIGMLVGAIIATGGFFIYQKMNHPKGMLNGDRQERMMERGDGETPPEKPDGEQGEPPDKKDKQNTTNNTSDETTSNKTSDESGDSI